MVRYEYEGGKYHGEIPIIYSAVGATAAFKEPSVEGAEKENAYHIANAVGKADKQKNAYVYYVKKVKRADSSVKYEPSYYGKEGPFPGYVLYFAFACWFIVPFKLLLAAHAFKL